MTPKIDKEVVFRLWDGMGVKSGPKVLKYVGSRFDTWKEYYELVAEYYGIQGGVQGLKDSIIDYGNEYLSSIEEPCPGTGIRLYNVDIEKEMSSSRRMYDWVVNKMGTKPTFYFAYSVPTDWECSVDVNSDDNDYYNEMECFDDECLMDPVRAVGRHIEDRFGIYGNVEMTFEGNMRGNIKIDKYEK